MLGVITPVLSSELECKTLSIFKSFINIIEIFEKVKFVVVIQGTPDIKCLSLWTEFSESIKNTNVIVNLVIKEWRGVSRARNEGLCLTNDCDYVLFHDASIHYPKSTLEFFRLTIKKSDLVKGFAVFSDDLPMLNSSFGIDTSKSVKKSVLNPYLNPFLWTMIFKRGMIKTNFDCHFGPGDESNINCGEDVVFIQSFLSDNNSCNIVVNDSASVFHPPRSNSSTSKHIIYAYGQGKLFRVLLTKHFSFSNVISFCLFFGNSIFRLMTFRKHSAKIFFLRMKGLFER